MKRISLRAIAGAGRSAWRAYVDRQRAKVYHPAGDEDLERHLRAGAEWLARAQDAGTNRGISYGAKFGGTFLESYPETTGYIIPVLLELGRHYSDTSWVDRAVAAGEWESAVQMAEGGVMGGMLNANPTPAVFNTGMVLLGWAELILLNGHEPSRQAAIRACRWLLDHQDADGCWRRGNSQYANAATTVYNVKAAWGMCKAGFAIGSDEAIAGAERNAEYAVSQQLPNGWFANNCLTDATRPLLHTTAYVMQGLIGIGTLTGRPDLVSAAARTADSLILAMDPSGYIPGRSGRNFEPQASWCCLTGSAQTGIVWAHLYRITGQEKYKEALQRVNRYLMRHHDVDNENPAIRGGVPGSWPVWGEYGRLTILNWATNFFVESLLMERSVTRQTS